MDVHCSACGEPWDTYHLWQDAIYDSSLDEDEIEAWLQLPTAERLAPRFRTAFTDGDWEFGDSILDVRRCPGCDENSKEDPDKVALKQMIIEMLGDDEDGIAVSFEDAGL